MDVCMDECSFFLNIPNFRIPEQLTHTHIHAYTHAQDIQCIQSCASQSKKSSRARENYNKNNNNNNNNIQKDQSDEEEAHVESYILFDLRFVVVWEGGCGCRIGEGVARVVLMSVRQKTATTVKKKKTHKKNNNPRTTINNYLLSVTKSTKAKTNNCFFLFSLHLLSKIKKTTTHNVIKNTPHTYTTTLQICPKLKNKTKIENEYRNLTKIEYSTNRTNMK